MNDHNWTEQHLAWYLNGTLVGEEYARVHRHLKDCLVCQQELSAHQRLAEAVARDYETFSHSAAALGVLSDKLTAKQRSAHPWRHRLVSIFAQTPFSVRGLVTLQTALLVLATVFLFHNRSADEAELNSNANQYRTLSSASPVSGDMRVIFTPDTSIQSMQGLLASIGATITNGPGQRGVITLTLSDPARRDALKILRNSPYVQLAEPLGNTGVAPE